MRGFGAVRCERDLIRDCDSVTREGDNLLRMIGKDANIREAEVAQDLRANAAFMLNQALAGEIAVKLSAHVIEDARERALNRRGGFDGEAAAGVVEIHKDAATFGGDGLERARDDFTAIAAHGGEDIAREAMRMDTHDWRGRAGPGS